MGAEVFEKFVRGTDAQTCFDSAVSEAQWEHGHMGYTGTIAEKTSFVMIEDEKPLSRGEARRLAEDLIASGDERIDDKWGPAGCIACYDKEKKEIIGFVFLGWASA